MVWQESERMLLEEPRHEDLNKRSVCPASHAGSCHEWQGKLCSHPQCIRTEISEKYLEQIITALSRAKLVKSARGAQGGYKLVKAPEEYTTGEILRAVEGSLAPVACLEPGHTVCARAKKCITLNLYKEIQEAVDSVVDRTTLADLVAQQEAQDKA